MRYDSKVVADDFDKESARVRRPGRSVEVGHLRADREGVWLDGRRTLSRDEMARGYVQPAYEKTVVRLESFHFFGDLEVEVRGRAEGVALLQALGLDAGHATVTFRMVCERPIGTSNAWQIGMVALCVAAYIAARGAASTGQGPGVLAWLFIPLMLAGSLVRRWVSVSVGADGVLLEQWGDDRFLPYESIDEVTVGVRGVSLRLVSGERVILRGTTPGHIELGSALTERIQEGLAAYRSRAPASSTASLVARGGRPVGSWLEALRTIPRSIAGEHGGDPRGAYRTVAVPKETLWRIVEDPAAEESARAGAAVALGASPLDDDGRSRLASAARAAASPRVRIVLEHAARGDQEEDELVAALEACGGDPGRRFGSK